MDPQIKITEEKTLSDNWYILKKISFEYTNSEGHTTLQNREAYDRGNGAVILLYNPIQKTVILTRQFRLPTFINGNPTGMLIEACAGLLDKDNPEDCIKKETQEETGYQIENVEKIFELYMSPGSVTEILYFFIAAYSKEQKINEGGGLAEDNENIEVLELPFDQAYNMIGLGEIKDAKTIILLQYAKLHQLI